MICGNMCLHMFKGFRIAFFDQRSAGSILVRIINDTNSLQELFTNGVINIFMDILHVSRCHSHPVYT